MRPQTISVTGDGANTVISKVARMNVRQNAFKIGVQMIPEAGANYSDTTSGNISLPTGYQIQYTMIDPANYADETAYNAAVINGQSIWVTIPSADIQIDTAAGSLVAVANIVIPVQSVRLRVGVAETETITATILQGNAW